MNKTEVKMALENVLKETLRGPNSHIIINIISCSGKHGNVRGKLFVVIVVLSHFHSFQVIPSSVISMIFSQYRAIFSSKAVSDFKR